MRVPRPAARMTAQSVKLHPPNHRASFFFFEKKQQKTFIFCSTPRLNGAHSKGNKSFLVLFFKKEQKPYF
jgi:hypothetical protein